jgi:hypothetical protein
MHGFGCNGLFGDDDDSGSALADDDDSAAGDDDSALVITETWTLTFPADGLESVGLRNALGEISLSGSDGRTDIEVLVTVHSARGTVRGPAAPIEISGLPTALTLNVASASAPAGARIDLLVSAPAELPAELSGAAFPLSLADMVGGATISSTSGAITGLGLGGDIQASAGNASILLAGVLPAGGSLTATLLNGPIELDLPADTSATLSATATDGTIEISGVDFEGVVIDGQAQGVLGEGEGAIDLSTGAGNIRIRGHGAPEGSGGRAH